MENEVLQDLAATTGQLALKASRLLEQELDRGGDTKRAKELSGIMKDMSQLARELRGGEPRTLSVAFLGSADSATN